MRGSSATLPDARSTVESCRASAVGVRGDGARALGVVVAGDLAGRAEHLVDRRREPAAGAVADQLAADDQHQHRRDQRHAEQHRHQLGAEPRERQRPPPLDDQLQDVARQHEDQREHQRQVGDRHRVEHDLAEQVGRAAATSGPPATASRRAPRPAGRSRAGSGPGCRAAAGEGSEPPQASRGHGRKVEARRLPCAEGRAHGQNDQVWRGRSGRGPARRSRSSRCSSRVVNSGSRSNIDTHRRTSSADRSRASSATRPSCMQRDLIAAGQVIEADGHRDAGRADQLVEPEGRRPAQLDVVGEGRRQAALDGLLDRRRDRARRSRTRPGPRRARAARP